MPTAKQVAELLAYEFMRDGRFVAAGGPVSVGPPHMGAAISGQIEQSNANEALIYAGLSLQAVGYEEEVQDPRVFIYLSRGSQKTIKALPAEIEDVPVTIRRMGAITVRPETAAAATNAGLYFERGGRICCGSSCAPTSENCSGTLGALVRIGQAQHLYVLSNNHVLAGCNHVPKRQPILSPSSNDSRPTLPAPREIARHSEIVELRTGDPGFVDPVKNDVALGLVSDPSVLSSWQGDSADGYDTPANFIDPVSRTQVKKFGRTTGLTYGEIESKVATATGITYSARYFKGVVWFTEVWAVRSLGGAFALPGDSGSLVVTEDGASAVGLVFAANGTGEYAWIVPLRNISEAFGGIHLVHGHGT